MSSSYKVEVVAKCTSMPLPFQLMDRPVASIAFLRCFRSHQLVVDVWLFSLLFTRWRHAFECCSLVEGGL